MSLIYAVVIIYNLYISLNIVQSAGAVKYTDYTFAEG